MANKTTFTYQLNWVTSNPAPFRANTAASGVIAGVMTSTNTIYSQIIDVRTIDNCGLEVTWTGTPTGTIQVMGSASGATFYALSFATALTQPAGSGGGYLVNLNQFPWNYLLIQYVNASGTGALTAYLTAKGLQ